MAKKTNGNSEPKAPPSPLPRELVQSLPVAAEMIKHLTAIERLYPALAREMAQAKEGGSIPLARAFVVLHRVMTVWAAKLKPFSELFERYKTLECPAVFEHDRVTHVPLMDGYRVTVSYTLRASVLPDQKEEAYNWLREHYPDCVIETVNASTLSALARELAEEHNFDLPETLFRSVNMPGTSVTRT